jgi:hypothetical protein
MSTREDELPSPAPRYAPDVPDPPVNPTWRRIFLEIIRNTGNAARFIALIASLFACLPVVLEPAKGVHLHWRDVSVPIPSIPALSTISASVIVLLTAGVAPRVKKAIRKWRKARKKARKARKKARKARKKARKARKKALKAQKRALEAQEAGAPSREPQTNNGSPSPSPGQHQKQRKSRPLPRTRPQLERYRLRLG